MSAKVVGLSILLVLVLLWLFGYLRIGVSMERFNNVQPVDFRASMLNKYQDYIHDNIGMKNRDYLLEGLVHS